MKPADRTDGSVQAAAWGSELPSHRTVLGAGECCLRQRTEVRRDQA